MSRIKVLHLAKWYPNKDEPLLGIFVRKHIVWNSENIDTM